METYNILIKAKLDPCRTIDMVKKEYNVGGDFCTVNGQYADVTLEVSKYLKPVIPFIKGDIWVARSDDFKKFYTNDKDGEFFRFAVVSRFGEVEYYSKASLYRMIREKAEKLKKVRKVNKSVLNGLIGRMERFADIDYCEIAAHIDRLKDNLLKGAGHVNGLEQFKDWRVVQIDYINLSNYDQ